MKKRIMFFISTMAGGGAEKVLVNLLKALDCDKYDITVISVLGGENLKDIPEGVKIKQIVKGTSKLSAIYNKILHNIPRSWFAALFLKGNYDIEIAYLPGFPTRIVSAKKSKPGTKKFVFVHGKIEKENMNILGYKNTKECWAEYAKATKVCFVSEDAKNTFEAAVGKLPNSEVIYNVINYKEIKELSNEPTDISYTTKGKKLIAVGRLVEVKGYERLLRVVKKLNEKYDFELWILGKGPLHNKLSNYIEENKLDNVKLLGYHTNPYKYINQADLLVSSSYSEGYSAVAIEALVLGVPVIATHCPGLMELLNVENCGIVAENSEDSLYECIDKVFGDEELYAKIKANAQQYSKDCEFDNELQRYIYLFDA